DFSVIVDSYTTSTTETTAGDGSKPSQRAGNHQEVIVRLGKGHRLPRPRSASALADSSSNKAVPGDFASTLSSTAILNTDSHFLKSIAPVTNLAQPHGSFL